MSRPRYRVLADQLAEGIARGDHEVGTRLPTEIELSAEHGLSRWTVREALRCLEDAGMISRSPRSGTVVTASRPTDGYQPSASTPDEVMELVNRARLSKPTVQEVVADRELAERLGVECGSCWHLLAGALVLRSNPRVTLCWSENYLPNMSSTEVLRKGKFTLADVEGLTLEQVVTAETMRPEVAERLGVAPGSPALVVRRSHFDDEHRLIKVGLHTHPGDRYRVTTIFHAPRKAT